MNRREFIQCAAVLVSGTAASQIGFSMTQEQQTYLATAPAYTTNKVNYFSEQQRKVVSAIAEIIIPRTETPGAIDAGVPKFIELMVSDWLNEQELEIFRAGMKELETRIPQEFGAPFDQLEPGQQLSILEDMEAQASDSAWYDFGSTFRQFVSDAPFICQLKELTIFGFFTSEIGCTQVLRDNPMPMKFDGDIPLAPDESTWSTSTL